MFSVVAQRAPTVYRRVVEGDRRGAVTGPPATDAVLELADDAAVSALERQDDTLGALRNRATGLLSAATVATTFSAGVGLLDADTGGGRALPQWSQWSLLVLLLATAGFCISVMWPTRMVFGADPGLILARRPEDIDQVREYVIGEAIKGKARNQAALERKFLLYRLAVLALTAEVAVFLFALIVSGA